MHSLTAALRALFVFGLIIGTIIVSMTLVLDISTEITTIVDLLKK